MRVHASQICLYQAFGYDGGAVVWYSVSHENIVHKASCIVSRHQVSLLGVGHGKSVSCSTRFEVISQGFCSDRKDPNPQPLVGSSDVSIRAMCIGCCMTASRTDDESDK